MHYFISDLHLGHDNILKYDNRPFASIEEHDEKLTENILRTVQKGDTLWILGDVAWSQKHFDRFHHEVSALDICYVKGNHDIGRIYESVYWPDVMYRNDLMKGAPPVFMSHYPHLSWPNSYHGSIHLYGHVHGHVKGVGKSVEVSANVINYVPISLLEVIKVTSGLSSHV